MALFHYIPLHSSPFGKRFLKIEELKVTDLKSKSIIRMPLHLDIKKNDIIKIRNLLTKFFIQKIVIQFYDINYLTSL